MSCSRTLLLGFIELIQWLSKSKDQNRPSFKLPGARFHCEKQKNPSSYHDTECTLTGHGTHFWKWCRREPCEPPWHNQVQPWLLFFFLIALKEMPVFWYFQVQATSSQMLPVFRKGMEENHGVIVQWQLDCTFPPFNPRRGDKRLWYGRDDII